jgi:hypothetical protein
MQFQTTTRSERLVVSFFRRSRQMGVSLNGIQQARQRIKGDIYLSPAPQSDELSKMTGQQVFLSLITCSAPEPSRSAGL